MSSADESPGPRRVPIGGRDGDGRRDPSPAPAKGLPSGDADRALRSSSELAVERAEELLRRAEAIEPAASAAPVSGEAPRPAPALAAAPAEKQPSVEELLDKLKRARADLANFQRRVERERESWGESARRQVLLGVLPTLDDLELVVQASGEHPDPEKLRTAVTLIRDELLKYLTSQGVSPIKASGETFDPEYHEALYTRPAAGVEPGVVVDDLRKGYMLGEKVLRPSQVAVSASAPPPVAGAAGGSESAAAPAGAEGDAGPDGTAADDEEGE